MLCCVLLLKSGGVAKATLASYSATLAKRGHTKFHVPLTERLAEKVHRNEEFSLFTFDCKHTHTDTKHSVTNSIRWRSKQVRYQLFLRNPWNWQQRLSIWALKSKHMSMKIFFQVPRFTFPMHEKSNWSFVSSKSPSMIHLRVFELLPHYLFMHCFSLVYWVQSASIVAEDSYFLIPKSRSFIRVREFLRVMLASSLL